MTDLNPYATPESPLTTGNPIQAGLLTEPRKVSAGRGWGWIADGFGLFILDPGIWIVNILILFAIQFLPDLIGPAGAILGIFQPVFQGGLIYGCYVKDTGNRLKVEHLFAGFKSNFGSLLAVAALSILGGIIIAVVTLLLVFLLGGTQTFTEMKAVNQLNPGVMLAILIGLALLIPLIMATWFAPALVMLHSLKAVEAMKLSFRGCLHNIAPFLIYSLFAVILMVYAVLPILLGLLVLVPTLIAATYIGYKDIFLKA